MRAAGVAFLAATLVGAILTPVARAFAHRWGLLDHALSSRKVHGKPIPRFGGVAIVLAFYAPLFVNTEVGRQFYAHPQKAFGLFAGGVAIAALGVWDDLKGANAKTKFLVQFAVAGAMYALGFRIDHIANPFGGAIQLGHLAVPFTMLWIAGVINALNLIDGLDGLDGLAGGVALIAIVSTFAIAVLQAQPLMVLFTAALAGAVLGFLFYNFNPASPADGARAYGASIVLGGVALALSCASSSQATWFLLVLSGVAYVALRRLGYISLEKTQRLLLDRRHPADQRLAAVGAQRGRGLDGARLRRGGARCVRGRAAPPRRRARRSESLYGGVRRGRPGAVPRPSILGEWVTVTPCRA